MHHLDMNFKINTTIYNKNIYIICHILIELVALMEVNYFYILYVKKILKNKKMEIIVLKISVEFLKNYHIIAENNSQDANFVQIFMFFAIVKKVANIYLTFKINNKKWKIVNTNYLHLIIFKLILIKI